MKVKKTTLLILAIFLFGAFLRFFRIGQNLLFDAEHGVDYLAIKSLILARRLPLLGPATSHPWLRLGSAFYWLMMPLMALFNFNPKVGTYLGITAGSFITVLNFWVIRKIFNERVALLSSLAVALSPFLIEFSRAAKYYFLMLIPFYLFLWSLYKVWQGEGRFLFWAGVAFGLILNFHLSPIFFVPIILIILWVKRKNLSKKNLLYGFFGFLTPNLPFLIYDFTHGFLMTTKLLAWIPYRIAGFLGFYPKNNLTPEVLRGTLFAFFNFFSESFVVGQRRLGILFIAAIVIFIALNFKKAFATKKKEDFGWFFALWALGLGFLALFIHGLPPKPYFISMVPILILIFSLLLEKIWDNRLRGVLILTFFLMVVVFNLRFFLASPSFYASCGESPSCFQFQKRIVEMIIGDAKGEKFNLKRVGEFDYYSGFYAQNYQYLLWWLGNEPTEEKAKLRYTIYEDLTRLPEKIEEKGKVLQIGKVLVLKEEVE